MQTTNIDGVNVRYQKTGQGEPLVLIHHVRGQLEYFDKIVPSLSKNHTVYALDLPGHGGSDIPQLTYTANHSLKAAKKFIQQLELDNVSLLGESIGGSLVLALASDKDLNISKVVAVNAFDGKNGISNGNNFAKVFVGMVRLPGVGALVSRVQRKGPFTTILEGGFHNPDNLDESLVDLYLQTGKREGMPAAFRSFLRNSASYAELNSSFSEIEAPVMSIRGESDWLPAAERNAYIADVAHAEQVTIEGAGHFASQEAPERVLEEVQRFFLKYP